MKSSPLLKTLTAALLLVLGAVLQMHGATFTVTNTDDSGPGSLRQAVLDANASAEADTIVFDSGVFSSPQTITLATEIDVSTTTTVDDMTIIGPGSSMLTISGNSVARIFDVGSSGDMVAISGMTLTKGAGNNGGAIQNSAMLTLTDIAFVENVNNSGGAIYSSGNGTTGGVLTIQNCTFTNNQTTGTNINGDGGSALEAASGRVTIRNSVMRGGTTRGGGGAIRNGAVMEIFDSIIENNTSGGSGNSDGGGAIYNSTNGELTLTNCIVRGNKAGENTVGGGIRNENQLTLINTVVTNNTAEGHGGGIYEGAGNSSGTDFLRITNSTISNNVANTIRDNSGAGGGIYDEGGVVTIIGSTIHGNQVLITATPVDSTVADGGGIFSEGKLTIDRCTISGNTARQFGGVRVPHVFHDTVVTNSTITNNTATLENGGGGFGKERCNLSCTDVAIGNTIISGNVNGDLRSGAPDDNDIRDVPVRSLGYNLIHSMTPHTFYAGSSTDLPLGTDPKFDVLRDNGGPTLTHAPQPDSPVIDKGKRLSDATTDQRGVTRPNDDPNIANAEGGDGSDIGAFEIGAPNAVAEKTLGNIATRLQVETGENVLIGGIIVVGDVPKRVIIRALGPSLGAAGVAGALENPTLELFQGDTLLAANDDWKDDQQTEISDTGVAPSDDREAAIVRTLEPGSYTAILRGKGGTTGVGLVEAYDLDQRPNSKLANISTRGLVGSGENVLIGGFIVGPTTKVVVRAIGPSLGNAGVAGVLSNPTLQLVNSNGEVVRENDDWKGTQKEELEAIGIEPNDDRESALISTLTAGNYTAVVRGVSGGTGVGLVEVYNLP